MTGSLLWLNHGHPGGQIRINEDKANFWHRSLFPTVTCMNEIILRVIIIIKYIIASTAAIYFFN